MPKLGAAWEEQRRLLQRLASWGYVLRAGQLFLLVNGQMGFSVSCKITHRAILNCRMFLRLSIPCYCQGNLLVRHHWWVKATSEVARSGGADPESSSQDRLIPFAFLRTGFARPRRRAVESANCLGLHCSAGLRDAFQRNAAERPWRRSERLLWRAL